jgi:large subunit ribosomal protein L10
MERAQKQEFVDGLAGKLAVAECVYVTDFTGLDVERMTQLRSKLRSSNAEYVVVKNTLARRAIAGTSAEALGGLLEGPTAFALSRDDVVAAARALTDFAKDGDLPRLKGGIVAGRIVGIDEIRRLASLPGREALLGQMVGSLKSPIQGFVYVLSGVLSMFVRTVDALRAQKAEAAPAVVEERPQETPPSAASAPEETPPSAASAPAEASPAQATPPAPETPSQAAPESPRDGGAAPDTETH